MFSHLQSIWLSLTCFSCSLPDSHFPHSWSTVMLKREEGGREEELIPQEGGSLSQLENAAPVVHSRSLAAHLTNLDQYRLPQTLRG